MNGVSDKELIRAAYMHGLRDGRDTLAEEVTSVLKRDPRDKHRELENALPERMMSITELGLPGPAHDALVAAGIIFVRELTALTESQFTSRFRPSPSRLAEYVSALNEKNLAFKDAS